MHAGVVLSISHDGEVHAALGVVRQAEEKMVKAIRKRLATDHADADDGAGESEIPSTTDTTPMESGLPKTLIRDLSQARTRAIRFLLTRDRETALAVTVAAMIARSVFKSELPGIGVAAHAAHVDDLEGADAGLPMQHDWFNGSTRDAVLRKTVADTVAELAKTYGSTDPKTWRQRIFYRFLTPGAAAQNPDKPTRRGGAGVDRMGSYSVAAGRLGLLPAYITDNGSEGWNMLVEVKKGDLALYDSTATGGQNLFIGTDGKGNANIGDQVKLHESFEFKRVDLDRALVERDAVSVVRLTAPSDLDRRD